MKRVLVRWASRGCVLLLFGWSACGGSDHAAPGGHDQSDGLPGHDGISDHQGTELEEARGFELIDQRGPEDHRGPELAAVDSLRHDTFDGADIDLADSPSPPACEDLDGDGHGANCSLGSDCDDANPWLSEHCEVCWDRPDATGCICDPVLSFPASCFEADPLLIDVGACRAGQRHCNDGFWSPCEGQQLPVNEACDDADNDCDGLTDEEVRSACDDCNPLCQVTSFGPTGSNPFAPDPHNSSKVQVNADGQLELIQSSGITHFIWIANSGEDTVSKLDTDDGTEVGRYFVCDDPSRTSVDLVGDVWVGCRGDGNVAKIAGDRARCRDRNGNGTIETASGSQALAAGLDECVLFVVQPDGPSAAPRALTVDRENFCWVGFSETGHYRRLAPENGEIVASIDTEYRPYGAVIDQAGVIWVSMRNDVLQQFKLGRIDPQDPSSVDYLDPPFDCVDLYGIAVDRFGRIWLGNASCNDVLHYDPVSTQWGRVALPPYGYTRGLAASLSGRVCVAHHTWTCQAGNRITCINDQTFAATTFTLQESLGGPAISGPVGVAFDFSEKLWAVGHCANAAFKIDPLSGDVIGEYGVGLWPYTYSDMTGYALHGYVAPEGYYDLEVDSTSGKLFEWLLLDVAATLPEGTTLAVQFRSSWDAAGLSGVPWSPPFGPYPPAVFPLDLTDFAVAPYVAGPYLSVRLVLRTTSPSQTPVIQSVSIRYQ